MTKADPSRAATTGARSSHPWLIVAILLLLYIFSFIDRTIINMMVAPIERDLGISDFEMSLLLGPAFGLFYVFSGLFTGWMVDNMPRRIVTAVGVGLWGIATFCSGFAANFVQLAIGRMGVGVGESTLTPAAHSLIADSFPPHRLSTALSIFTMGAVIGGGIALVVGGAVVHAVAEEGAVTLPLIGIVRGWQAVFIAVGFMTMLLTPLILLISEPKRGAAHGHGQAIEAAMAGMTMTVLLKRHWRLYVMLPVGFGCTNILVAAYLAWAPTFMMRSFGLNAGQVGMMLGVQSLIAGLIGQVGGAMIVDRLYARGMRDAHARYHMVGLLISAPAMILAFTIGSQWGFVLLYAIFNCLTFPFVAYAAAALQIFTPGHLRGRVSALFLAIITTIGSVLGPTLSGWFTDHLFGGKAFVGQSLSLLTAIVAPVGMLILWSVARYMRQMHEARA